ncbi:MAG TPA: BLUF domain-containing protein [Kofleriaceae bacterium]
MATPHLVRIAYASALRGELSRDELDVLLSKWRRRNAERAITGVLLHHRESVFQVLEGFPDLVRPLYETISQDPRHDAITTLIDEPAERRCFGDWSVGHARIVYAELGQRAPLDRLLDPGFRYWQCDEPMARALVGGFTTGPWRRAIS